MQQAGGGAGTKTPVPSSCPGLTAVTWGLEASQAWALLRLRGASPGWWPKAGLQGACLVRRARVPPCSRHVPLRTQVTRVLPSLWPLL